MREAVQSFFESLGASMPGRKERRKSGKKKIAHSRVWRKVGRLARRGKGARKGPCLCRNVWRMAARMAGVRRRRRMGPRRSLSVRVKREVSVEWRRRRAQAVTGDY